MSKVFRLAAFATCLTMASAFPVTAQEIIDAPAMGTSKQLGNNVRVKVIIDRW